MRNESRRCRADLRLVAGAHRRLAYVLAEHRLAEEHGNTALAKALAEERQQLTGRAGNEEPT